MDLFEAAARTQLRFQTRSGPLSPEQLFDLPLQSDSGRTNLDEIAVALHKKIETAGTTSFVDPGRGPDKATKLAFDVVKRVIEIKIEEAKARSEERERAQRKQALLAAYAEKKGDQLKGMSLEELERQIAAL